VTGRIVYVDRFGNAFSNLTAAHLKRLGPSPAEAVIAGARPIAVCSHYAERPRGEPLSLINSSGYLEIAVNGGNASEHLGLRPGDTVTLRTAKTAGR
jgi:S-adenosylmethionine hydrolase